MVCGPPGALGAHRILRADGTITPMAGADSATVGPVDLLVLETPDGGGHGEPD